MKFHASRAYRQTIISVIITGERSRKKMNTFQLISLIFVKRYKKELKALWKDTLEKIISNSHLQTRKWRQAHQIHQFLLKKRRWSEQCVFIRLCDLHKCFKRWNWWISRCNTKKYGSRFRIYWGRQFRRTSRPTRFIFLKKNGFFRVITMIYAFAHLSCMAC